MNYILKPSSCIGCPFYTKGKYFTPDHIVEGSEVFFLGQNPGENEEQGRKLIHRQWIGKGQYWDDYEEVTPQPLIGPTGNDFNKKFLPLSGLKRENISVGNAIRCRPGLSLGLKDANNLPPISTKMSMEGRSKALIVNALKHCRDNHFKFPPSTKLIVTMGSHALFQLTGQNATTEWRGYAFDTNIPVSSTRFSSDMGNYIPVSVRDYNGLDDKSTIKIFSTMHPANIYKGANKKYYHAIKQDFLKMKRYLNGSWPLPLPTWKETPPSIWPEYSVFDSEYDPETKEMFRWSLCDTQNNLYTIDKTDTKRIPVYERSTVLIQNAYTSDDILHLSDIIDLTLIEIEDLMGAHSVLYTGEPHSLNYIASIFGAFNRFKHLNNDYPELYSALDAYEPMYIWRKHFIPMFKKDKASWNIYKTKRLPLINMIRKAQSTGYKLNSDRLIQVAWIITKRLHEISDEAKVLTGDPTFNIGGQKRMKEALYGNA